MILCNEPQGVFTLHTKHTTYQMKADRHRVLLHTYYGPRISGGDLSCLVRYMDRGCSPNPPEAGPDRTYSLDTLPQEYSACGVGDFRLPSLELVLPNGSHSASLRYAGFERRPGKYALEGLPAFRGTEEEAVRLARRWSCSTASMRTATSSPGPCGWSIRARSRWDWPSAPPSAWTSSGRIWISSPLTAAT